LLLLICLVNSSSALTFKNHYSPLNRERPKRRRTDYIILHTTEGPKKGSLNKVHRYGETHYFVDEAGRVYRIIDKKRVAFHAGLSMWKGRSDIDKCSIGIEVVGYHNKGIAGAQYAALRQLLADLQRIYGIPDDRVLTHSMVAYGAPNRWHRKPHRGRKRCGMLFAGAAVRAGLGLDKAPLFDPDVRAGRLTVADPYLARALYRPAKTRSHTASAPTGKDSETRVITSGRSAWDIAKEKYKSAATIYSFPDGTCFRGDQITDWRRIPIGTRVTLGN